MKIIKKDVGKRISSLRKQKNLTMDELAKIVGVSGRSTINGWEKGRSLPPKINLAKMAKYFKTDENYLLYGSFKDYIFNLLMHDIDIMYGEPDVHKKKITLLALSISMYADNIFLTNNVPWKKKYSKAISNNVDTIYDLAKENNLTFGDDNKIKDIARSVFDEEYGKTDNVTKDFNEIENDFDMLINNIYIDDTVDLKYAKNLDDYISYLKDYYSDIEDDMTVKNAINIYYRLLLKKELVNFQKNISEMKKGYEKSLSELKSKLNTNISEYDD